FVLPNAVWFRFAGGVPMCIGIGRYYSRPKNNSRPTGGIALVACSWLFLYRGTHGGHGAPGTHTVFVARPYPEIIRHTVLYGGIEIAAGPGRTACRLP